jgi:flagellar basal body-associated protein FliL
MLKASPGMLLATAIVLLVAGFALGAFAIFQIGRSMSAPQTEQQTNNQQKPASEQNATSPPVSKNEKEKPGYWSQIKQKLEKGWDRFVEIMEHNDKAVVAISTMVIALFTALLVAATAALFISSERVADAAKESADAAQISAKAARDALILTQRANIIIQGTFSNPIGGPPTSEPLKGHNFQLRLKNAGQTTAKNIRAGFKFEFLDKVPPADYNFAFKRPAELDTSPLIDVGRDTEFQTDPQGVAIELINRVAKAQGMLLCRAYLTYNDVFEGTPIHHFAATIAITVIRDPNIPYPSGQDTGPFGFQIRWLSAD